MFWVKDVPSAYGFSSKLLRKSAVATVSVILAEDLALPGETVAKESKGSIKIIGLE